MCIRDSSQLIATPILPKRVIEELDGSKRYYEYKERCIYCDIIKQELKSKIRVVAYNEMYVAIEPFASRFPFETWILPRYHEANFEYIKGDAISRLADLLKTILKKLSIALNNPPYNMVIHSLPLDSQSQKEYHWHIEIIPKLTKVAGFEWGTGFYINPTIPEDAAKYLIEVET